MNDKSDQQDRTRSEREIDDLDRALIGLLQEDGRMSFPEIGKRLGVSANTARSRFGLLKKRGAVQVLAIPESAFFNLDFHAVLALRLKPGSAEAVAQRLAPRPEIGWIGIFLTGFDLMFELSLKGNAAFGDYKKELLVDLPEICELETFLLSDVSKFHYALRSDLEAHSKE